MAVARLRVELGLCAAVGALRYLLHDSGAGLAARSSGGKRAAGGARIRGGYHPLALPAAAVPHRAVAVSALAPRSVDSLGGGSYGGDSRPLLERGQRSHYRRGDGPHYRQRPLRTLPCSPLPWGKWG